MNYRLEIREFPTVPKIAEFQAENNMQAVDNLFIELRKHASAPYEAWLLTEDGELLAKAWRGSL